MIRMTNKRNFLMFKMKFKSHNLVTILQRRSSRLLACVHLDAEGHESARITYRDLDQQARVIAAFLQTKTQPGDRVLLAYPAGIDFVTAFVGCLYAGVIAVPVHCQSETEFDTTFKTLNGIALDANISGILTTQDYAEKIEKTFVTLLSLRNCFIADTANLDMQQTAKYHYVKSNNETIAYLHYAAVSSETPKAVVVRHKNLNHALKYTAKVWSYSKKSVACTWMSAASLQGFFFGIVLPLYSGASTVILSPDTVRKNPLTWLQAITKYRVTHSGTLNSGYDLCVREIDPVDLVGLDLRSWRIAFNTGENISHETLASFHKKFSDYGFRPHYFNAAYAMSEAVGIVAVGSSTKKPAIFNVNVDRLKNNDIVIAHKNVPHRKFVSNGHVLQGLDAIIVDTEKMAPLAESKVGEIWLTGAAIVDEYWNDPDEGHPVFGVTLPNMKGKFFRTGDLGFIKDGEICFVGRLYEIFTVAGKQHYPLDLETTVTTALRSFPVSCLGVAFTVAIEGQDEVVYLQELKEGVTDSTLDEIARNIRRSVSLRHGINLHAVLLVEENSLPKAANGKLQRLTCQKQFLAGSLAVLKAYTHKTAVPQIHVAPVAVVMAEPVPVVSEPIETPRITSGCEMAIIGMNGLLPGAESLDVFWDNLVDGVNAATKIPASRWSWEDYYGEPGMEPDNKAIKWGHFVEHMAKFDASFFNLSAREAELTDPQQRIFLQVVWRAIEDAGYTTTEFADKAVGVFVGASNHDYAELLHGVEDAYTTLGLPHSMIANRISCLFKFNGPSQIVDTAGSSSLVALHHAMRSIESGDCEVAIVGGVNGLFSPTLHLSHSKAGMLSEDGKCKAFDKDADGYVRGEGAAAIIIKPLYQAQLDGDHIYGVIKSSAVNHGSHARSLFVPCQNAQADVVIKACQRAEISPETVTYIETNAVGSLVGDAIEVNGLKSAFGMLAENTSQHHYCGLGSVKTNIGHLEAASGMASLIKVLLAMKYKQLPGSLHFNELNPQIELTESPFYIVDELQPWARLLNDDGSEIPRRAGVSAFGAGGTHAHVILEEYVALAQEERDTAGHPYLITLSAKTETELRQRVNELQAWLLAQAEDPALAALSYTLNAGRHHFEKRCAMVVGSISELRDTLHAIIQNHEPNNVVINIEKIDKAKFKPIFQTLFRQLMQDLVAENTLAVSEHRSKLLAIGNFYTEGYELDWLRLHCGAKQRLSLPVYPFSKEHYWVPNPAVILEFASAQGSYCSGDAS
jgi:acyl-CoA synthetase (AMP-forming)/AMP-acid ligase II/3-oxoacyl-(acyl-carrier-protein) synthase